MAVLVVISMNVTLESMIVTSTLHGESFYDIDACFMDIPCDVDVTCMNSIDSYSCKCDTKYSPDGLSYTNIIESYNSLCD